MRAEAAAGAEVEGVGVEDGAPTEWGAEVGHPVTKNDNQRFKG